VAEIRLEGVWKVYPDGTEAVCDLDLAIADGEFVVLVGPSGCGKTTALRMVAGLEAISKGTVSIGDRVVNDVPPKERDIAMVFQNYALYPHMTVFDNMAFGLKLQKMRRDEIDQRVQDAAHILGLDDLLRRKPAALSGGQRQRVAMGRAIVRHPQVFLMDEPLSNLDAKLRVQMRSEIARIQSDLGVTTIYVTHDQAEALTMADRVAILRRGVLQDVGTPTQVYSRPGTLYVAAFLGSPRMNLLEASVYVHLDRYIALHLGEQALYLPWHDMRARQVAHYHGERIVVGVRAEALTPVVPDTPGDVLHGRVRYIEHHGHESLAFIDIGAYAVPVDDVRGNSPAPTNGSGSRISKVAARFKRSRGEAEGPESPDYGVFAAPTGPLNGSAPGQRAATTVLEPAGRHHRARAEVAVRLAPYPSLRVGDPMSVAIRIDQLHFFDGRGQRIDVGWR